MGLLQQGLSDPPQLFCHSLCPFFTVSDQPKIDESRKGGIFQGFPEFDLFPIESDVVLVFCLEDTIMVWIKGLDDHFSKDFPSPCPSRHLGEKLKSPLTRPKVRKMKGRIRRDHTDKGHIWKIMAFDDHLCPY